MDKKDDVIHFIYYFIKFLLTLGVIYLLFKYALVLLIGAVVAYLLKPLVTRICQYYSIKSKFVSNIIAIIIVIFTYMLVILFFIVFVIVSLRILSCMPSVIDSLYQTIVIKKEWLSFFTLIYNYTRHFFENILSQLVYQVMNFALDLTTVLVKIFFSFLFSILFMIDFSYIKKWMLILPYHCKIIHFIRIGKQVIYAMIKTYVIIFVFTFFILICCLSLVLKNHVFLISFFISLFDFLPILGIDMIMLPWIAICFITHEIKKGIFLIITYVIVIIMKNIMEPKLLGNITGIKPSIVFVIMFLLMNLGGIKGLLILPIVMIVLSMIKIDRLNKNG